MPPDSTPASTSIPTRGSKYRLVVFDWDGTLLDSVSSILECTHATLEELKLPGVDDDRVRGALGLGLRDCVEALAPGCSERVFHAILDGYGRHWDETYSHRAELFEGAVEALDELERRGMLIAIATAKSRRGLEADLAKTGLQGRFHATRTVDESASKPAPGMLLEILAELGARENETLMIGDSTHDLAMANNAGTAAIGVSSGSQTRAVLEGLQPLAILDSVADLIAWMDLSGVAKESADEARAPAVEPEQMGG